MGDRKTVAANHDEMLDIVDARIHSCRDNLAIEIRAMRELVDHFGRAFPVIDGELDVVGHRKFHEAKIEAAKAEARFWDELRLDIAKKGVWGLLVILVGLVMIGLSVKMGFGAGLMK